MKKKNGSMTLEKLAQMVQRGFEQTATKEELLKFEERVAERFEAIESRFEAVEQRLDAHEQILRAMQKAFEEVARELRGDTFDLEQRVVRLERKAGLRK